MCNNGRKEYKREYYLKNKETIKKKKSEWYLKNKKEISEKQKRYREKHKDASNERLRGERLMLKLFNWLLDREEKIKDEV